MKRTLWLAIVVLAVVGCASPAVAEQSAPAPSSTPEATLTPTASPAPTATPAPTSYPCDGSQWELGISASTVTAPIDGIRATIAPTDEVLLPCDQVDRWGGASSVLINLAYPAGGQRDLIQFGIMRQTGLDAAFIYTADNSAGSTIVLPSPRPEADVTYTLSIQLDQLGGNWVLRIADDRGMTWMMEEPAHWTDPRSAWVMAETYDHSVVRNAHITALELAYSGKFSPAAFTDCRSDAATLDGQGGYAHYQPAKTFDCLIGDDLWVSSAG